MLAIQEYISSFDELDQAFFWLKKKLGIVVRQEFYLGTNLWQLSSAKGAEDTISRESNGLILDSKGNIICMGPKSPKLLTGIDDPRVDWSNVSLTEKEEGDLVMVYFKQDMWHIATERSISGTQDIKIEKNITSTVRFEVITKLNTDYGSYQAVFDHPDNDNICYALTFSYPNPHRVYSPHKCVLTLETAYDRRTGIEIDRGILDDFAQIFGFDRPITLYLFDQPAKLDTENKDISRYDVRRQIEKLMGTLSPGIEIVDGTGEKYFLTNRLYNALYITKISGNGILPVHVLNVLRCCRHDTDFKTIRKSHTRLVPVMEMFIDAQDRLTEALRSSLSGTDTSLNYPGGLAASQKSILDSAKNELKDTTPEGLRKAIASVRPDKVVIYTGLLYSNKFLQEMQKLKED